jgi:hypothetical protein
MKIKLDQLSFEEVVAFIFDHPVTDPPWHFSDAWEYSFGDGTFTLRHLIHLFRSPEFLFQSYSLEQLEQGFFFLPNLLCVVGFRGLLWAKGIPLSLRVECIEAMSDLFERFFPFTALNGACFMWWDQLAYGYYMEDGVPADEDGAEIQRAMFATLCRILSFNSRECQRSALHGLAHLMHPDTEKVIRAFLSNNPAIDKELKEYALACIAGEIQ